MSGRILCPHCLVELPTSRTCPSCGKSLDLGDWPPVAEGVSAAPWNDCGLSQVSGTDAFCLPPLASDARAVTGTLRSPLPYAFPIGKSSIRLGSDERLADLLIAGSAPLHAALLLNRRTRTWWAFDCSGDRGLFVNGTRIRLRELQRDDVVELAGLRLRFAGDRLESYRPIDNGMAIAVRDLTFKVPGRPEPVLDRVSFTVAPGEFIGILGPSGCGKSSLVQRLIGLSNDFTGRILINGNNRADVESEFRAATAYLPQNVDDTLHPSLTLAEEVDSFRRLHLAPGESSDAEAADNVECLRTLGLSGRDQSRIGALSGGEKRRVGIALALLRRPRLLLLDEPGAGLDPSSESALMQHLRGIADQGRTVLCVTHVLANADKFDKLLVLSHGKAVFFGPPAQLLSAFKVANLGQLYERLVAGVAPVTAATEVTDDTSFAMPESSPRPGWRRVLGGYLRRTYREFTAVKRLSSPPLTFFLWQPLCLVVGLRIACACYFRSVNGRAIDVEMLGFCAALSMFWIGINNAARDFVRERVPGRCLERLNRVPLAPYVLSKVVWTLGLCAAQTLAFTLILCFSARLPMPLVAKTAVSGLNLTSMWFGPLYLTCLMGAACGLSVSAIAKREIGAIAVVPNVAILALLFSNAVVRFEFGNDFYTPLAKLISIYTMPCHWPTKVLVGIQSGNCSFEAIVHMVIATLAYCALAGVLISIFQRRNESAWDGR